MNTVLSNLKIQINEKIFVKNPETSDLGKKILEQSILLIDDIGFDNFTFKKLGEKIGSNESSIYRYFENKHKLLVYLSSWYWSWMEYKLVFATANILDPKEKLKIAITIVTEKVTEERTNIFCCKFSDIRSCIKDKIPTNATPKTTNTINTIQEVLTLPD